MERIRCFSVKVSKLVVGTLFLFMGAAFLLLGFTVIPVFGFILAIPAFALAIYFIRVHLNRRCEITQ
jgi:hypothetical protein